MKVANKHQTPAGASVYLAVTCPHCPRSQAGHRICDLEAGLPRTVESNVTLPSPLPCYSDFAYYPPPFSGYSPLDGVTWLNRKAKAFFDPPRSPSLDRGSKPETGFSLRDLSWREFWRIEPMESHLCASAPHSGPRQVVKETGTARDKFPGVPLKCWD